VYFPFHFISALCETNRNSYPNQKSHFSYLQKRSEKSTRISSKMDLFRERVYDDVTLSSKGKEQHVLFISFPPVWCMHEHSITDACFASDTLIFRTLYWCLFFNTNTIELWMSFIWIFELWNRKMLANRFLYAQKDIERKLFLNI